MFFSDSNQIPTKEERLILLDKSIDFLSKYRDDFKNLPNDKCTYFSGVHHRMFYGLKFHLINGNNEIKNVSL